MKKVLLFVAVAAFVGTGMTSCKKTYDCECSVGGVTATTNSVKKMSKDDAKLWCETNSAGMCKLK